MIEKHAKIYKLVGTQIRIKRKDCNYTQAQLASKSGLDRAKISDMENAKEDFMFSTLLEIANALDIDVADLLRK